MEGLSWKVLAEYHNWHSKKQSCSPKAVRPTQPGRILSGWGWDLFTAGYNLHHCQRATSQNGVTMEESGDSTRGHGSVQHNVSKDLCVKKASSSLPWSIYNLWGANVQHI